MNHFLDRNGTFHADDVTIPGRRHVLGPTLACLLTCAAPLRADPLIPSSPLALDVAALPRLSGGTEAALRINPKLDMLDARDLDAVNCFGGSRSDGPFRSVEVLADGPDYLSFLITTGTFCEGAAHPWSAQETVTFDLATGLQTDLRDLLPDFYRSAGDKEDLLAVLFLSNVNALPEDCALAYAHALREGYLSFDLAVVEAQGALMLWPQGLAYVDTPCLDLAYVPANQLREVGFDSRLTNALSDAP